MEPISPRDIARPSRSSAVRLYRLSHLAKDVRMFSHCKVVVAAPDGHDFSRPRGLIEPVRERKRSGEARDVRERAGPDPPISGHQVACERSFHTPYWQPL